MYRKYIYKCNKTTYSGKCSCKDGPKTVVLILPIDSTKDCNSYCIDSGYLSGTGGAESTTTYYSNKGVWANPAKACSSGYTSYSLYSSECPSGYSSKINDYYCY